ncbi:hypothetical protein FF011L_30260 [Roseimaritima multifibrata]|uniref:Uncharacterized protein n=1 Tax=Roseimaritima multifibrata TaxID=1930274 RepID=A0A517MHJ3_9BACT|nr:hypothetical protein FF011L_30260 [Roseimaritima multifibrata]
MSYRNDNWLALVLASVFMPLVLVTSVWPHELLLSCLNFFGIFATCFFAVLSLGSSLLTRSRWRQVQLFLLPFVVIPAFLFYKLISDIFLLEAVFLYTGIFWISILSVATIRESRAHPKERRSLDKKE